MPATTTRNRPEELAERLGAAAAAAAAEASAAAAAAAAEAEVQPPHGEALAKTIREVKNQIIGNKTKKLLYLHLGAVPKIVSILASAAGGGGGDAAIIVQAAAAIGSFACGVEDGVRAVLDAGAVPHLIDILSHPDEKVVDAGARSLKIIFQSKLAPKYDVIQEKNRTFVLQLLKSNNENVTELAATIIAHSCERNIEQQALFDAGVLQRLVDLLGASSNQKDASLDSIAAIVRNNSEVASKFAAISNGKALSTLTDLIRDRYPQTRLLSCVCLIALGFASPWLVQDLQIKSKLVPVLVELLEEPGQVGDDAPFALTNLIADDIELQKQALSLDVLEKLFFCLQQSTVCSRRLHGTLLALSEFSSKLEKSRSQLASAKVSTVILDALKHDSADVRLTACHCMRNICRSLKSLSAGYLSSDTLVMHLLQLLQDESVPVQIAALGAICNLALNCKPQKSVLIQCRGVPQLVQISKSMDPALRLKSVWTLRNLMFLADVTDKEYILEELTLPNLASLISDSEYCIQEQALALVCNLIDGCRESIRHVFSEDHIILNAVMRLMQHGPSLEVCIQGMFLLCNVAAGSDSDKKLLMDYLVPPRANTDCPAFLIKFLQSSENLLRVAATWCIVNLTYPGGASLTTRIARLQDAGVVSQLKTMVNDPCLDCKLRVRMALEQCTDLNRTEA